MDKIISIGDCWCMLCSLEKVWDKWFTKRFIKKKYQKSKQWAASQLCSWLQILYTLCLNNSYTLQKLLILNILKMSYLIPLRMGQEWSLVQILLSNTTGQAKSQLGLWSVGRDSYKLGLNSSFLLLAGTHTLLYLYFSFA